VEVLFGLGRQSFWRAVEVGLIGGVSFQAGVGPDCVVELDVPSQAGSGLLHRLICVEVDLLVLDRSPDALDEDIVAPTAFTVHADGDVVFLQQPGEDIAGELAALVGVEYLRPAVFGQRLSDRFRQKKTSMVIDTRQDKTRRLNQSTTAAR
jgi:hypothetical protein